MGLFSKLMSNKKETSQTTEGLQELIKIDLTDGEFTFPEKFWGHISRYLFRKENNTLWLNGDKYFSNEIALQIINEFADKFGLDGHGCGKWSKQDEEDLKTFGSISRNWYFDKDFNGKPAEWITVENNNYDYNRMIRIDFDKNDDEVGVEIQLTGWNELKDYLSK